MDNYDTESASPVIAAEVEHQDQSSSSLVTKIQATRNTIKAALSTNSFPFAPSSNLELENKLLKNELAGLNFIISEQFIGIHSLAMCDRFATLEARLNNLTGAPQVVETKMVEVEEEEIEAVDKGSKYQNFIQIWL